MRTTVNSGGGPPPRLSAPLAQPGALGQFLAICFRPYGGWGFWAFGVILVWLVSASCPFCCLAAYGFSIRHFSCFVPFFSLSPPCLS